MGVGVRCQTTINSGLPSNIRLGTWRTAQAPGSGKARGTDEADLPGTAAARKLTRARILLLAPRPRYGSVISLDVPGCAPLQKPDVA